MNIIGNNNSSMMVSKKFPRNIHNFTKNAVKNPLFWQEKYLDDANIILFSHLANQSQQNTLFTLVFITLLLGDNNSSVVDCMGKMKLIKQGFQ